MMARVPRPRPVTATVTRPSFRPRLQRRAPSESSGSTDSLLSVLDHDSCSDISSDDDDDDGNNENSNNSTDISSRLESVKLTEKCNTNRNGNATFTISDKEVPKNELLSPWQQWMLKKAQKERLERSVAAQKRLELRGLREKVRQEKEEKMIKVEQKRQEWLDKKNLEQRLQEKLEKQKIAVENDLKRIEKYQLQLKAEHEFKEWMDKKNTEKMLKVRSEKSKKLKESLEKKEKQRKAEERYKEWKNRAASRRPASAGSCYLPAPAKDKTPSLRAYPSPAYVNPRPWIHPSVPTTKPKCAPTRKTKKCPSSATAVKHT